MNTIATAWMLGCTCGFFMGVTVAGRRRPTCRELMSGGNLGAQPLVVNEGRTMRGYQPRPQGGLRSDPSKWQRLMFDETDGFESDPPIRLDPGVMQRGNGVGDPTTPKPEIVPKGQGTRTARQFINNPVQIAECGGPCTEGPEHCDCGEPWVAHPDLEGELTDEELLRTYGLAKRDHCYEGPIDDWPKRAERAATVAGLRAVEAAVIARGPAPAPPAEGEVAELVDTLYSEAVAEFESEHCLHMTAQDLARAAELLQRQYPQPVPVSERPWERDGWCDENGWCWFGWAAEPGLPPDASWSFCRPSERDTATVSLPHNALPPPSGEVAK